MTLLHFELSIRESSGACYNPHGEQPLRLLHESPIGKILVIQKMSKASTVEGRGSGVPAGPTTGSTAGSVASGVIILETTRSDDTEKIINEIKTFGEQHLLLWGQEIHARAAIERPQYVLKLNQASAQLLKVLTIMTASTYNSYMKAKRSKKSNKKYFDERILPVIVATTDRVRQTEYGLNSPMKIIPTSSSAAPPVPGSSSVSVKSDDAGEFSEMDVHSVSSISEASTKDPYVPASDAVQALTTLSINTGASPTTLGSPASNEEVWQTHGHQIGEMCLSIAIADGKYTVRTPQSELINSGANYITNMDPTLEEALTFERRLTTRNLLRWTYQILGIVEGAHAAFVAFNDFQMADIRLTPDLGVMFEMLTSRKLAELVRQRRRELWCV
jgi:hypothetical protein